MNKEEKGASITIQASGFPLSAFKEWDESCKKDFGDCRWVKIMHDHKMANNNIIVNLLLDRIEALEKQLSLLISNEKNNTESQDSVRTLGGELK